MATGGLDINGFVFIWLVYMLWYILYQATVLDQQFKFRPTLDYKMATKKSQPSFIIQPFQIQKKIGSLIRTAIHAKIGFTRGRTLARYTFFPAIS